LEFDSPQQGFTAGLKPRNPKSRLFVAFASPNQSIQTHQRPAGISQTGRCQRFFSLAVCALLSVLIPMFMPPPPVFRLFLPAGLCEFMRLPVIFRVEADPRAVLMLIPIVIVLVLSIVNAIFMIAVVILLRPSHSFARDGHRKRCYY
jgi:hypothetical protein